MASIAWQLVAPASPAHPEDTPEAPLSLHEPDREELLACHDDLSDLLTRLGAEAGRLVALPAETGGVDIGTAWNEAASAWRRDREAAGVRCRFEELATAQRGAAYERMANVYAELPEVLEAYEDILEEFDDHPAGELAQMREALERSRETLERRHRAASSP